MHWTASAVVVLGLFAAQPVRAESDGSGASATEQVFLTGLDMAIVRPLAAVRVGIGSMLLVPAAILASPGCIVNLANGTDCRPIFEAPYDVLVGEPSEYAFRRKMGEL